MYGAVRTVGVRDCRVCNEDELLYMYLDTATATATLAVISQGEKTDSGDCIVIRRCTNNMSDAVDKVCCGIF